VLIPIVQRKTSLNVVLTKRTAHLRHHPGQVAFPGGKMDTDDPTSISTALRETHEEIGIAPDTVTIIGKTSPHKTVTGFEVIPVLGVIDPLADFIPQQGEVETVFEVPLLFLMNAANTRIESRVWQGHKRSYYTMPYGPFYIWGATARIIVSLQQLWAQTA
jgi:8-oxo-dGTP pyrophosphatase MutT (NUDIX family)